MELIVCVDDNFGMMFNKRRQSSDIEVTKAIINLCKNKILYIDSYSKKLFDEIGYRDYNILEDTNLIFPKNSCCFSEKAVPCFVKNQVKKIVLFKWNRIYPADLHFDIDLKNDNWKLISSEEFKGHSHEKINMEVYEK